MSIGTVRLEDGQASLGFLCEASGVVDATDITGLGSWRTYLDHRSRKEAI